MTDDREPSAEPANHEELEDERQFLLRSLDDLDSELLAGNIDPDTYRVLHDDYTARAAAVIQSIDDGVDRETSSGKRVPTMMRFLTIGGIVVFAVLAAVLLAHTVGQRRPGQEITGDAQAKGSPTTVTGTAGLVAAKAAATAAPKSYDARIRYARALFGSSAYVPAVNEYIAAAKLDPTQAEPLAYTGYLTAYLARADKNTKEQAALLDAAGKSLDRAIAVDPTYPDAYAFKGLVLSQLENKPCEGAAAFQEFLVRAPQSHPLRTDVLSALDQAVTAGKCPNPSTTPTAPTTSTTKP